MKNAAACPCDERSGAAAATAAVVLSWRGVEWSGVSAYLHTHSKPPPCSSHSQQSPHVLQKMKYECVADYIQETNVNES